MAANAVHFFVERKAGTERTLHGLRDKLDPPRLERVGKVVLHEISVLLRLFRRNCGVNRGLHVDPRIANRRNDKGQRGADVGVRA